MPPRALTLIALALLLPARCACAAEGSYRDELIGRAKEARLSGQRKWRRLMHYLPHGRGWRSEADGTKFFLSPEGRTDPQAELEATIAAFFAPPPTDPKAQHPQCRFPARYAWLKAQLAFDAARLPEQACPDFEAWRSAIGAQAVSLVFADAFLGNPSSMYGHTFLRMHRQADGEGDALLDYTINFEGQPDTDNMILYTLRGVYGGFRGEYSLQPFYLKTAEYTDLECRDMWDYRLNLTPAQIDFLLRHSWEMGSAWFDYYFFTKNCSYQLLTLLEAADDSLDVSTHFPLAVIPADTVRALLAQPGLVGDVHYRPSYATEMRARRQRLSDQELAAATMLGRKADEAGLHALKAFPPARQALVLDSAHDYLRYRSGFYSEESTATLRAEHVLLAARGRLGEPPTPLAIPRPRPLEAGHDTARAGLGFGVNRRFSFEELAWRGALHDLPAAAAGYAPDSQLEMGSARLRFEDFGRRPYIERLDLVDVVALTPWDPWVRKPSWKFSTGVDQAKELDCNGASCMYYDLDGGAGLSALSHLGRRELYYAMAEGDLGAGPIFAQGWRSGAGGTAGLMLDLAPSWRTLFEATYIDYVHGPSQERLRLVSAWRLSRDTELRVTLDRRIPDREAGASFYLYF